MQKETQGDDDEVLHFYVSFGQQDKRHEVDIPSCLPPKRQGAGRDEDEDEMYKQDTEDEEGRDDGAAVQSLVKMVEELKKRRNEGDEERLRRIERERQRRLRKEAERREAEEAKAELDRRQQLAETPKEALYRLYNPIFQTLWDMEFPALGNSNPFRVVIDKDTCVQMFLPDYCQIIKKPMNLTFVQKKVENRSYSNLQEFFSDIELIISNCITYCCDPRNPYHMAALELRKRYQEAAKRVDLTQI